MDCNLIVNPYAKRKRKRPTADGKELPASSTLKCSSPSRNLPVVTDQSNPNSKAKSFNKNSVSAQASALIISASDKAGMEGIDRSKIDEIILRESGDSLYIQQQRRRDEKINERIRQLQHRLEEASARDFQATEELDEMLRCYQQKQAIRATCVVVDMDMFYMACELLNRPDLSKKPACVGRGMILTSNYIARRYGVRSAMAGFIGDKLVEELSKGRERLIHVPSNFELYKEKSRIVTEVIREYDPHRSKSYSLDEVYLDIGPYLSLFIQYRNFTHDQIRNRLLIDGNVNDNGNKTKSITCIEAVMRFLESQSPIVCLTAVDQVILRLRRHIQKATGGLTCSAGVARTYTIAKIASDKNKPDGQLVVDPASTLEFIRELPVRKIPGVGRVTEKLLQNVCNIHTGMDLYQKRGLIRFLFQPATAKFLLKASVGCSGEGSISTFGMEAEETLTSSSEHQKGISRERSFEPESDWAQLNIRLEEISRMVSKDMIKKSVMGHTVTVKVKLKTFDVLSRSKSQTRGVYIQNQEELSTIASGLFSAIRAAYSMKESKKSKNKFVVRLLGIRCSNLIEESSFYGKKDVGKIDKFLTSSTTICVGSEIQPSENFETPSFVATEYKQSKHVSPISKKYASKRIDNSLSNTVPGQIYDERGDTKRCLLNRDSQFIAAATDSLTVTPNEKKLLKNEKNNNNNDGDCNDGKETEANDYRLVHCPLCHRPFSARDNDLLNAHIDICLNGIHGTSTVRQVVKEEESRLQDCGTEASRGRKQLLTDFWN